MNNRFPVSLNYIRATLVVFLLLAQPATAAIFTYQGQLVESGAPATGPVNLAFRLYDAANGGVQIGPEQAFANFSDFADGGEFTVELDFGAGAFPGAARWLEIRADGQALSPRLPVRATPYAMHAESVSDGALPIPYGSAVDFSNAGNDFNGSFGGSHSGNGSGLTSLNASNLSSGTVGNSRLAGTYSNALTLSNAGNDFNGSFSGSHSGNGSGLTSLNASNLSTGTVGNSRLSGTYGNPLTLSNAGNSFMGSFSGSHSGNGSGLTSLNASNLSSGTVGSGRLAGTYGNALTLSNAGNAFSGDGGGLLNIDWDALVNVPPGFADGIDNTSDIWNTNGNDVYYDTGNVGIGTSTAPVMLTVGAGNGAVLHVGQQPQLNLSKDTVDNKFRVQLTGSGYGGYQLQIGRDDGGHEVLLKGDVGIGTENPTYPLHVVSNTTAIQGEGVDVGVAGTSDGTIGIGVHGSGHTGVRGDAVSQEFSQIGVGGFVLTSGLSGDAAEGAPPSYGVFGATDYGEYFGVFSFGDMGATGLKPFVIDHPFDPENKYLRHYASEGPEPLNVYRGRVTLDGLGEAVIELPDYFEAINRDPLYTLTAIGAAMPNLHVAEEVVNNEFRIAGGQPGMDVSWRVEGVRDDPYVRSRGAPVEVDKSESERGLYQYPEFYDQPPEKGINYVLMHRENDGVASDE